MFSSSLVTGFTTGAGLIVCIGSQNAFVLRQGLLRRHINIVACVCILSDILLISCGVSGIGFIVTQWPDIIGVIRYAGALFLGANAVISALRAWHGNSALTPSAGRPVSRNHVLLTCLGYTFLNPHIYLDTVFILGSLSAHYTGLAKWEFGLGAIIASVVWFSSITYGAKLLQPLFRSVYAWRILDASMALIMGYLGVSLLLTPMVQP